MNIKPVPGNEVDKKEIFAAGMEEMEIAKKTVKMEYFNTSQDHDSYIVVQNTKCHSPPPLAAFAGGRIINNVYLSFFQ